MLTRYLNLNVVYFDSNKNFRFIISWNFDTWKSDEIWECHKLSSYWFFTSLILYKLGKTGLFHWQKKFLKNNCICPMLDFKFFDDLHDWLDNSHRIVVSLKSSFNCYRNSKRWQLYCNNRTFFFLILIFSIKNKDVKDESHPYQSNCVQGGLTLQRKVSRWILHSKKMFETLVKLNPRKFNLSVWRLSSTHWPTAYNQNDQFVYL